MQTHALAVPYAVSVHGMHFADNSKNGVSISKLYVAAARYNERLNNRDEKLLDLKFRVNPLGFEDVRGKFTNMLTTYHTTARTFAADILHACFSTPRGAASGVSAHKLDAIHALLGLQHGQALLDQSHPVCLEYAPEVGGGIKRVFPLGGSAAVQVFTKQKDPQSETSLFLLALGEL